MPATAPTYPVPLDHWVKWLGNISAIALVVGGILLAHGLLEISLMAWEIPLLGILAAVPLLLETGLVVWGAGRLWQRLDPSGEILGEA